MLSNHVYCIMGHNLWVLSLDFDQLVLNYQCPNRSTYNFNLKIGCVFVKKNSANRWTIINLFYGEACYIQPFLGKWQRAKEVV